MIAHPEGYLYRDFARTRRGGGNATMPGLIDGLDEAVLASHRQNARWARLDQP